MKKHKIRRRTLAVALVLASSCILVVLDIWGNHAFAEDGVRADGTAAAPESSVRSWPKDINEYQRPLVPEEWLLLTPRGPAASSLLLAPPAGMPVFPDFFISDTVVDNTDTTLQTTDTFNDGETSIAVNPLDTDEIVISAFSGGWGANAPIFHTTDGGNTWTKQFTVPVPPGWPAGCPCDWTWDYGRNDDLSGTILANSPTVGGGVDVVSVTSTDPASAAAFAYFDPPGAPVQAQETNINVATSLGNADQPWLLVNRDTVFPATDNVYVGWDDFNNSDGVDGPDIRVAVSYGVNPPNFTADQQVGNSNGFVNPGTRLADDRASGDMWVMWGRCDGSNCSSTDDPKDLTYMLNRSTDGGATWSLNGNAFGIAIANTQSTQPQPKFGSVNALLGNVIHGAVDPGTGDLYYVYGNRDAGTGNDRLAIRRITDAGGGLVSVGAEQFVTGQVEAALPSVAVTDNGTLGVFYYTYDGDDVSGFPQFTAHLALSTDQGATFTDQVLLTFLSSATDNGNSRQRVLGDYMQMKALGNCFFGSFTGNGAAFGRTISNHDPIFFKTCVTPPVAKCKDIVVNTDPGVCSAAFASIDDGSFDPDGQPVTLEQSPAGPYMLGSNLVTLTVTDSDGLIESCSANVTVLDNESPTLTAPVDVVAECTAPTGTFVNLGSPTASDNCPGLVVGNDASQPFALGDTAVTWMATDSSGNMVSDTQIVTVEDTMPPDLLVELSPDTLWPPNHNLTSITPLVEASDMCDASPSVTLQSISSNEPDEGLGDGDSPGDIVISDDLHFQLRSERSGLGGGRIYTIVYQAQDGSGNTTDREATVSVPKNQGKN